MSNIFRGRMDNKGRLLLLLFAVQAAAYAGGTGFLPAIESPILMLANSFSGPIAFSMGVLAFGVCVGHLAFTHDFKTLGSGAAIIVVAVGLAVGATRLMTTLYGVLGAVV